MPKHRRTSPAPSRSLLPSAQRRLPIAKLVEQPAAAAPCLVETLEQRVLLSYTLAGTIGFNGANGQKPESGLITDGSGNYYGTTFYGGASNDGTVFKESDGTIQTLATFNGPNGMNPSGLLVLDDGNLYGTTENGGASGDGVVFEISGGAMTTLASFDGADGATPLGGLVVDGNELVGDTSEGGDLNLNFGNGDGVIYEVAPGTVAPPTVLVTFDGANGAVPEAGLTLSSGALYGTTSSGGVPQTSGLLGDGTLFQYFENNFTTLAAFNYTNGQGPRGGVYVDANDNLWGTAQYAGSGANGVVWEYPAATRVLTDVVSFNGNNGADPFAGLAADSAGNLYGTTLAYGPSSDYPGEVFEIAAATQAFSVLYTFPTTSQETAGALPVCDLIVDSSGDLFGTTENGGPGSSGEIFELSPASTSTFATLTNGNLDIEGTSGDDAIGLTSDGTNVTATLNGTASQAFSLSSVTSIVVNGNAGNDSITIDSTMPASLGVSVQGGPGDDTIIGGPGNDTLGGGQGNDSIQGGPGDDSAKGGAGDDTLLGGKGNDTLFGGPGNDLMHGGLGDDYLNGGAGTDYMSGGAGNNTFYAVNGTADQIFAGTATNDSLFYSTSDNPVIESGSIPAGNKTLV